MDRDQPNGRPQWRFTVFAQDEGGEGLVGYADVQVNLKDVNDNAPLFPQGVYFGNVTENGTAGMLNAIFFLILFIYLFFSCLLDLGNFLVIYFLERIRFCKFYVTVEFTYQLQYK